jgi:hypothetical protein
MKENLLGFHCMNIERYLHVWKDKIQSNKAGEGKYLQHTWKDKFDNFNIRYIDTYIMYIKCKYSLK